MIQLSEPEYMKGALIYDLSHSVQRGLNKRISSNNNYTIFGRVLKICSWILAQCQCVPIFGKFGVCKRLENAVWVFMLLVNNGPFPSCLSPLFQSKSQCKAFHRKISFIHTQIMVHLHVNKTNFQTFPSCLSRLFSKRGLVESLSQENKFYSHANFGSFTCEQNEFSDERFCTETVSQSCAVAKSEIFWLPLDNQTSKVWFSYSHNCTTTN